MRDTREDRSDGADSKIAKTMPSHFANQCKRVHSPRLSSWRKVAFCAIASWGLGLGLPLVLALPATSAEQIIVSLGLLEFSLSIETLETYARQGKITEELESYAGYISEEQLEDLRELLVTPVDISPVAIAQFLYSPQGELLLQRAGELVQTSARQSGFYAIRAALILAAADEEGLTLLEFLQKFPTDRIYINTSRGFEIVDTLTRIAEQTQEAIIAVEEQAVLEQREAPLINFSPLPDLRQPGPVPFGLESFVLTDARRGRVLPIDLYLPALPPGEKAHLIAISHGLGSDRQTFAYLATHLASYGFAVAVIEHPGSSAQQLQALLSGFAQEVSPPLELVDRPLDIKFVLDRLAATFGEQLILERIGVLGQSYGAYTSLALAGADVNYERLQAACPPLEENLNLSLLLQCQALRLPAQDYNLQLAQIGAAIAINPFSSQIFGQDNLSEIEIPLMIVSGSADVVTPALTEQIRPFTWINTPQKYLVLLLGGTHFSTLAESEAQGVPIPSQAIGPDPAIAQIYLQALSVAFFKTYIAQELDYRVYLDPGYAQFLSQPPLPLLLIESLTPAQLQQELRNNRPRLRRLPRN